MPCSERKLLQAQKRKAAEELQRQEESALQAINEAQAGQIKQVSIAPAVSRASAQHVRGRAGWSNSADARPLCHHSTAQRSGRQLRLGMCTRGVVPVHLRRLAQTTHVRSLWWQVLPSPLWPTGCVHTSCQHPVFDLPAGTGMGGKSAKAAGSGGSLLRNAADLVVSVCACACTIPLQI